MIAHLKYLRYVLRHKWFVLLGCLKTGAPLHLAILHDWSKFLLSEWWPYVRYFYGNYPDLDYVTAARRGYHGRLRDDVAREFNVAWLHHQRRNKHHWQYWLLTEDERTDGSHLPVPLVMPDRYVREMVADWYGAGRALNKPDTRGWYETNRHHMIMHPQTRRRVEQLLEAL